jgi:hypothetical protein
MKSLMQIAICLSMLPAILYAQEPSNRAPLIMAPERFDQWGDVRLNEEDAHLDKLAAQAQEWPLSIIYLFIHAGQTACVGEASARGTRAKNYLMHKGISSERIVVTDAGWQKEVSVQVWIWPPELGKPKITSDFDLKRRTVKLERNCKIKHRGRISH